MKFYSWLRKPLCTNADKEGAILNMLSNSSEKAQRISINLNQMITTTFYSQIFQYKAGLVLMNATSQKVYPTNCNKSTC